MLHWTKIVKIINTTSKKSHLQKKHLKKLKKVLKTSEKQNTHEQVKKRPLDEVVRKYEVEVVIKQILSKRKKKNSEK
jgi:hypothetical protein